MSKYEPRINGDEDTKNLEETIHEVQKVAPKIQGFKRESSKIGVELTLNDVETNRVDGIILVLSCLAILPLHLQ
jgi:hypothetical protein